MRQPGAKMNIRKITTGTFALLLATSSLLAQTVTRLDSMPGSKVRIEGTSSIHDWRAEANFIGGRIEAGPNFPTGAAQHLKPGKVDAKADAWITVRALTSREKNGEHYKDSMDEIMWGHLKQPTNPRISYHLTELVLKEVPKTKDGAYVFDSTGNLTVAGVTNKISMPITVTAVGEKKMKISGSTMVKMSDFSIDPVKIAVGIAKTGNDVKVIFDWIVGQKEPAAAAK